MKRACVFERAYYKGGGGRFSTSLGMLLMCNFCGMRTSDVLSGGFELAPSPPVGQHFYAKGDSIMSSCLRGSGKRGGNRFLDLDSAKFWC